MQPFIRTKKPLEGLTVQRRKKTIGIFGRSEVSIGTSMVREVFERKILEKVSRSSLQFQANQLNKD
jgi:hypothetical protein